LSYTYNDDNDLTGIADSVDGSDSVSGMQYDGLHRLINANGTWGYYAYYYDSFDNITNRNGGNALTYTYDYGTNHLTGVSGAVSRSYGYDSQGRINGDGNHSFNWNEADEITNIPGVANYYYDARGKRIKTAYQTGAIEYALYDLAGQLIYTDKLPPTGGAAAPVSPSATNGSSTAATQAAPGQVPIGVPATIQLLSCSVLNDFSLTGGPQGAQPGSIVKPGPQQNSSLITFSWCSKPTDQYYILDVGREDPVSSEIYKTLTSSQYTQALHDGKTYFWRVTSCTLYNQCNSSVDHYFSTPVGGGGIPITPTAPNPGTSTAPGPTTADKNVTLSWYGSSDVKWYTIVVQDQASGAVVVNTTTSSTSYQARLSYSTGYVWTVNACNYTGCSDPTAPLYFQTPTPAVETQTDYLKLGGVVIAQTALAGGVTTVTYLHDDLLGSPRLATSASQSVLWHEHFDPYGQKLTGASEKIGYTGHAYDAESQLTYMQARFYDAAVGRFLSSDPLAFSPADPFTFGRYGYGNDSPYVHIDPTGMEEAKPAEAEDPPTGTRLRVGAKLEANGQLVFSAAAASASGTSTGSGTNSGSSSDHSKTSGSDDPTSAKEQISNVDPMGNPLTFDYPGSQVGATVAAGTVTIAGGSLIVGGIVGPVELESLSTAELKAVIGKEQTVLLRQLFGEGAPGAKASLENLPTITGLSPRAVAAYRVLAVRAIAKYEKIGNEAGVAIQSARVKILDALSNLSK
jgi:RHS repeat-associated protein